MSKPEKAIPNTSDIKNLLQRASNLEDEMDKIKEEKKDLAVEIKAAGLDAKAFRTALKQYRAPLDPEFAKTVNSYLNESGQGDLFA